MTVLDPDLIAQLREDLPAEVLATIIDTFEADAARLIEALAAAEAAGDASGFHRAAHTLAGAAGAVAARDLAATTRRAMAAGSAEERALLLPLIRVQARAALAALRALSA